MVAQYKRKKLANVEIFQNLSLQFVLSLSNSEKGVAKFVITVEMLKDTFGWGKLGQVIFLNTIPILIEEEDIFFIY